jgi:hypothetical protein
MVMAKNKKKEKNKWFVAVRGSYLPSITIGWLTYIPFLAYLLFAVIAGASKTDSTALAILFIVPNWVAAAVVMTYLAAHKS